MPVESVLRNIAAVVIFVDAILLTIMLWLVLKKRNVDVPVVGILMQGGKPSYVVRIKSRLFKKAVQPRENISDNFSASAALSKRTVSS